MNSDDDRRFVQRELLEFGAGAADEASPPISEGGSLRAGEEEQAEVHWFEDDLDRDPPSRSWPPQLPDRSWSWLLSSGLRLDRSAVFAAVAALVTVSALNVAFVGWATHDDDDAAAPAAADAVGRTHGLTENQAACFAYSRAEARLTAVLGAISPIGFGPQRATLRDEIAALDALTDEYPGADYRLIVAFHEVANASVKLVRADRERLEGGERLRYSRLVKARSACADIAGFDTETSTPISP